MTVICLHEVPFKIFLPSALVLKTGILRPLVRRNRAKGVCWHSVAVKRGGKSKVRAIGFDLGQEPIKGTVYICDTHSQIIVNLQSPFREDRIAI